MIIVQQKQWYKQQIYIVPTVSQSAIEILSSFAQGATLTTLDFSKDTAGRLASLAL